MVELQENLPDFERAGVVPLAISYDPVQILAEFATRRGITYRLLSDEDSVEITRLGLLNPYVRRQHEETNETHEKRFEGVPYPASFLIDEAGVIVDRRFHEDYRIRETAGSILRGRFGFLSTSSERVSYHGDTVSVSVTADSAQFSPFQMVWFDFEVEVAPGWHIYGSGPPAGLIGLKVVVDGGAHLQPGEVVLETHPLLSSVAGVDERVPTHQGTVRLRIPIVVARSSPDAIDVGGWVEFQACDETTCLPPRRVPWSLTLSPRSF